MLAIPLGLLGAVIGGIGGGFLVKVLLAGGLYGMPIMGLTVGYSTLLLARRGGPVLATLAGLVTLVSGVLTEWKLLPFAADESLGYFLSHLPHVMPAHLVFIAIAAGVAVWVAWIAPSPPKRK